MTLHLSEQPTHSDTSNDDGLVHTFCCDPDRALCGKDVSGEPVTACIESPDDCVVCEDLAAGPCGAEGCTG